MFSLDFMVIGFFKSLFSNPWIQLKTAIVILAIVIVIFPQKEKSNGK